MNNSIRKIINTNLYLSEIIKGSIGFKYNKTIKSFTDEISSIDSIEDVDSLIEGLQNIPGQLMGSSYSYKHSYGENTLYGYAEEVLNYAGLKYSDIFYLPLLEHGISIPDYFQNEILHPYIFEGRYKEVLWKAKAPKIPCYFIGPYIHYAKNYYDETVINEKKQKNGKTLLFFPPHSTEVDGTKYTLKKFDDYLFNKIGKQYDTLIACVFWANLNDPYIESLKERGVKIVCSGFKLDPLFVRRLKSIISLSDTVLYPSFTTSIGYAYYLKKKVICIYNSGDVTITVGKNSSEKEKEMFSSGFDKMQRDFSLIFSENDVSTDKEKYDLINGFWGLNEIKTPEEIRKIFLMNKEYTIKKLGF